MNRILILSVDFFPKIGGISLMTHHLANGFCQIGWDVTVVGPSDSLIPEDYEASYTLVADSGSRPKYRSNIEGWRERKRILRFLSSLGKYDHVLLLHPFYYGTAALDYARRTQATISCYFHGFELKSQLLHRDKLIQRVVGAVSALKSLRQLTISLAKKVDFVFTNSSETADIVRSIRSSNVFITGCGLDLHTFQKNLVDERLKGSRGSNSRNGKVLGFVGRLVESKNVEFLIDLLEILPGYRLLVVGDGPRLQELQSRAEACGVAERITWAGRVSEEEKWSAIDDMDLLCLPSQKLKKGQVEGFGIVMLEATLRGVPVAVSHEGGMRDFVLENNGLYLDIYDKEVTSDKIEKFLKDRCEVEKTVKRAQKLIEQSLTYDKIADSILRTVTAE